MLTKPFAQGLVLLLSGCLVACQVPGASTTQAPLAAPDAPTVQTPAVQAQATDTSIKGHVQFPEPTIGGTGYRTQATSAYITNGSTLSLISLSDNMTVVTGRTESNGSFALPLNGFTPGPNTYYVLEASRGLNSNQVGNDMARFRTILRWTGTGWTSISGTSIVINAQTTAVAVISSLDDANVPPSATIGKVSGTTINASPTLTGHADTEIATLVTSIQSYLTNDLDPIRNTPTIRPSVTELKPSNPAVGGAVLILGNGFSPVQSGNTVLFGTATASIFAATAKMLGVFVPPGAPSSGIVRVQTSLGTSPDTPAYTIVTAGTGGSGGGGTGGSTGLSIQSLTPPNGAPGDSIMIRGTGFSTVIAENAVKFNNVSATVSYADAETLIVTVPSGASSGPLTVTVGGVTKGFYFNFTVPIIASFSPNTGNQNTSVTVNGQNFATQGPQSKIRFNAFPSPNITSWFGTQAVGLAPAPSLTNRITGPVTIITDSGIVSQSGGTFTARQNVIEDFSTTNQRNGSTTAAWGSSTLNPAAAATTFTQSGTGFSSNTNSGVQATAGGLTLPYSFIAHTGVLPTYSTFMQLGVDTTSYFISNGSSNAPTIYRYSLTNGAQLGTSSREGVNGLIYDRTNNNYLSHDYYGTSTIYKYTNWNDASPITSGYAYSPYIATNGTNYFVSSSHGSYNIINTSYSGLYNWGLGAGSYQSAAGFAGINTFLFNNGNSSLSSLSSYTYPGGTSGTVTLPITVNGPTGGSYAYPLIGSDGVYLFILGTNASYNGGSNTLFRFSFNGTSTALASYTTGTNGTSVTAAISRPANAVWDAVNFNLTRPTGTSATIDILDGTTNAVLLSNVTNGQNLNGLTAASLKLRVTMSTTDATATPTLASWSVTTRGSYALSIGYDTGTNYGQYETPTITSNNANYTIQYSDSADNSAWSAWSNDVTTLSRRYIRYQVFFNASNTQITRINLPYTY